MQDTNTETRTTTYMCGVVQFAKIREEARIPQKRVEDAAFDIYACFEEEYIKLDPHETKMIPTGIASCCDSGYCFILKERGSTGSKGLGLRCGVVDSGYRGEWFVAITNHNNVPVYITKKEHVSWKLNKSIIYPYEKAIAQALIVPVPLVQIEEIDYNTLKEIPSERGVGKLGSSNK